ncbi:hypothetical protein GCM10009602_00850 [Nocardiopsis tropica]
MCWVQNSTPGFTPPGIGHKTPSRVIPDEDKGNSPDPRVGHVRCNTLAMRSWAARPPDTDTTSNDMRSRAPAGTPLAPAPEAGGKRGRPLRPRASRRDGAALPGARGRGRAGGSGRRLRPPCPARTPPRTGRLPLNRHMAR